ncbi:MAG: hypothetical protein LC713_01770 [Actinobacteria bacterium]|nr:hypothetical protein [Actinomycetota bacterium]
MTDTCSCGCSSMTDITQAGEDCGCGCECCGEKPETRDQEVTQLLTLRQSIDRRLSELGS